MLVGVAYRRACEAFALALASTLNSEADNLVAGTHEVFNAEETLARIDGVLDGLEEVISRAQDEFFRLRTGEVEE